MQGHGKPEVNWMKILFEFWKFNVYYLKFEQSIKALNVVNDCSERANKLGQDLINKDNSEEKTQ